MSLVSVRMDPKQESNDNFKKIENYIYFIGEKLGEGNFSEVFKGIDQNKNRNVAVKVVKYASLTNKVSEQLLKNQVIILRDLSHNNIIKCYDVFTSKNNCYIITQFCESGDLERLLQKRKIFNENDLHYIIYGIYKALLYLNQMGIIHRDLKPANILMTDGTPKLADFGFAVKSRSNFKDINIGSPIYMSPQGMLKHQYGPKSDIWSFGVMIYELLHGFAPLSFCQNQKSLKESVLLSVNFREGISYQLKKMIELCLTTDTKTRIDAKELSATAFMAKLLYKFESAPQKDLFSTNSTISNLTQGKQNFATKITKYHDALAILHYCRLLHKTSQFFKSSILSQWLLDICQGFENMKLCEIETEGNKNLMETLRNYIKKYRNEHMDRKLKADITDVINECQKMKKMNRLSRASTNEESYLILLINETQMICKCLQNNKLGLFHKMTQIQKFLSTSKNPNSHEIKLK